MKRSVGAVWGLEEGRGRNAIKFINGLSGLGIINSGTDEYIVYMYLLLMVIREKIEYFIWHSRGNHFILNFLLFLLEGFYYSTGFWSRNT